MLLYLIYFVRAVFYPRVRYCAVLVSNSI